MVELSKSTLAKTTNSPVDGEFIGIGKKHEGIFTIIPHNNAYGDVSNKGHDTSKLLLSC